MERTSKCSRLRITALAALIAGGLVLTAMSGSASATCFHVFGCTKRVSLGIRNSSKATITVERCGGDHANNPGNTHDSPCDRITSPLPEAVGPGSVLIGPNRNPVGIIIKAQRQHSGDPTQHRTLYFYVKNPDIGLPYFRAQGHEVELREGQASVLDVNGVKVELRRYHDEDRNGEPVKLMRIEILKWPGAV